MAKKMGRPKIEVDLKQLQAFCQVLCTKEEICIFLGLSLTTLDRRIKESTGETFEGYYKKYSSGGKMSLRRAQYKTALDGNPTMQIWLGKQTLGQKEKTEGDDIVAPQPVSIIIQAGIWPFKAGHRSPRGPGVCV
ncbi:MAG: hypothetical protein Q8P24_04210 [Desulfobacterales bacterium]|nr:hypothetical protein [Desulfobacterales bacterium]